MDSQTDGEEEESAMVLCSVSEEEEPGGRARTSQTSHGLHSWTSSGFLLSESAGKAGSHDLGGMYLADHDGAAELLLLPAEHRGTHTSLFVSS